MALARQPMRAFAAKTLRIGQRHSDAAVTMNSAAQLCADLIHEAAHSARSDICVQKQDVGIGMNRSARMTVPSGLAKGRNLFPSSTTFLRAKHMNKLLLAAVCAATSMSAGAVSVTGTCGCVLPDPRPVTCKVPHDCEVPRYMTSLNSSGNPQGCDHLDGTRANNRTTCSLSFPLTLGSHNLYDADQTVVAATDATSVELNFGTRRVLNGMSMLMAFAVPGTDGHSHSAWIRERDINQDVTWMPNLTPATPSSPKWEDRAMHAVTNRSYYMTADGSESLKVTTDCKHGGEWATDYLDKDNGHINLVYNTPGWGAGSPTMEYIHVGGGHTFHRDANIAHVAVPLYDCSSGNAVNSGKELWFLYGVVEYATPLRFGWIAYPIVN